MRRPSSPCVAWQTACATSSRFSWRPLPLRSVVLVSRAVVSVDVIHEACDGLSLNPATRCTCMQGHGIRVTAFYPSSMSTPGFEEENKVKPKETFVRQRVHRSQTCRRVLYVVLFASVFFSVFDALIFLPATASSFRFDSVLLWSHAVHGL